MCTPWGWAVTMDFWLLRFGERRSGARGAKQAIFLYHHGGLKPPLGSPASYARAGDDNILFESLLTNGVATAWVQLEGACSPSPKLLELRSLESDVPRSPLDLGPPASGGPNAPFLVEGGDVDKTGTD